MLPISLPAEILSPTVGMLLIDDDKIQLNLTAAMLKKYMGNDNTFNKVINEWLARASYASVPALPEATE